jgi:RimJ/RimL family protein N-acetyltransferase
MNRAAAESFLSETASASHLIPGAWIQLAVADQKTNELLGDVGLFLSENRAYAELGFTLASISQGKGHATRAAQLVIEQFFRLESIREVRAVTDELNHASVAVLSRVGFVQTGTRSAIFKGKPCVELLFARCRGDA